MHTSKQVFEPISRHSFQDESLLKLALTHSSCDRPEGDNQRLEFLGDAVLDLVIAETLYHKFPQANEGALDRCRASLVNGKSLARIARKHHLGKYLEVGEAHRQHHADPSHAMLEDALEALIGAVFLDGGLECARQTIQHLFGEPINAIEVSAGSQNPKGQLQEWSQKHYHGVVPEYRELPAEGPDHDRHYSAAVFLAGKELGRGTGSSKKAAEANAAHVALKALE
ncbi:ribonuclease III [Coraliomargarita sp. SDUM461004]|uniref:Ribonuclease 3 n=1 Tax=Thalassobacterium sedimentorum TaxID=3041258 RepID=A0ABU1APR8_9BACT|nr:ribonuclease III [Coraliomargarita sp. SDUM461004]MDQ8196218.1 ribonuclease III [Coraliomargarita sp. SDUM461004]